MTRLKLSESEYRFCQLLWREGAMEWEALLDLAQKELGWSRATAARQLRRLIRGGAVQRSGETVTALGNWEATAQARQEECPRVSRRLQAVCPLAFGESGVKGRIRSVIRYKKPAFWLVLAAVAVILAAAVCFLTVPVQGETQLMEFRGIPWNSTPEEVFDRLEIPADSIVWEEDPGTLLPLSRTATVTDWEVFGETAQRVRFYFSSYDGDGDGFGLDFVAIYYASDADQAAILSALRQTYGTEPETYPALDSLTLDMTTGVQEPGVIHWVSETTRGDLLTEEGRALYRAEQSSNMQEQLTDAQFENLLATPAGGVVWRENLYADEWIAEAMPDLPAVPYVGIEGGFVSYAAQRCNGAP